MAWSAESIGTGWVSAASSPERRGERGRGAGEGEEGCYDSWLTEMRAGITRVSERRATENEGE